ncbi:MAG: hypothetical protein Q7R73_02670 [bacterium]|nr:hypothetical protein [bacterium]
MNNQNYKKPYQPNGRSAIFNQLFGSLVNFGLKLGIGLLAGEKAARYSGRLRYRLTKTIGQKTINWK